MNDDLRQSCHDLIDAMDTSGLPEAEESLREFVEFYQPAALIANTNPLPIIRSVSVVGVVYSVAAPFHIED